MQFFQNFLKWHFLIVLFSFQPSWSNCENALTLKDFVSRADQKARTSLPKFTSIQGERDFDLSRYRIDPPKAFRDALPSDVWLIDHSLKGAPEGLVKTATGRMLHLGVDYEVNGKRVSTLVGVNSGVLIHNIQSDVKSFVRSDSEAVVLFIHGGGTKTTGHHVGANQLSTFDNYGVDVVTMDLPWHQEGSRDSIVNHRQLLEHIRAFAKKFLKPSGKPLILAGHSMGGVVSDLYMRTFPNDDLFSAVIPLSTVADPMPGGSLEAKLNRLNELDLINLNNPNIPVGERNLSEKLARDGKISPTCGLLCQVGMEGVDWTPPKDQGASYLPALYIIGRGDALYQGNEEAFAKGVQALKNAKLVVYDKRVDFKSETGEPTPIGHMIFDHHPPLQLSDKLPKEERMKILRGGLSPTRLNELYKQGLIQPGAGFSIDDINSGETYVLMLKFISEVVGKPIRARTNDERNNALARTNSLELILMAFANNLAFRGWAEETHFIHYRATQTGQDLGKLISDKSRAIRELQKKIEAEKRSGNPTSLLESDVRKLSYELERVKQIGQFKGQLPEDESQKAQFLHLWNEGEKLRTDLSQLRKQRNSLVSSLNEKQVKAKSGYKTVISASDRIHSPAINKARQASERAFKKMMQIDLQVRMGVDAYLISLRQSKEPNRDPFSNLPPQLQTLFIQFDQASESYQQSMATLNRIIIASFKFPVTNLKINEAVPLHDENGVELYQPSVEDIRKAAQAYWQLSLNTDETRNLDSIDRQIAKLRVDIFNNERIRIKLLEPTFFTHNVYTPLELLSLPGRDLSPVTQNELTAVLNTMWTEWKEVWGKRLDESDAISAY